MAEPPQTDVSRPSALPTANLRIASNQNQSIVDQNSAEYLEQIEEEWNKKVDVEVETLVDGMVDLVSLASVNAALNFTLTSRS
jgi:mediator of RNA polymerase II transcription subunit 22